MGQSKICVLVWECRIKQIISMRSSMTTRLSLCPFSESETAVRAEKISMTTVTSIVFVPDLRSRGSQETNVWSDSYDSLLINRSIVA